MTELSSRYTPDETRVAAETVDDEAIIVDLTTGDYYSMDAVAALIWSMIERHRSVEHMADMIARQYIVSPEKARSDLQRVLGTLLERQLIVPVAGDALPDSNEDTGAKLPYTTPEVRMYGDLSDLLAMDLPVPMLSPWRESQPLRS